MFRARVILLGLAISACCAFCWPQEQQGPPPPPELPNLSPPIPPVWMPVPEPPPTPSPPDAPVPDLGTLPGPADKSGSIIKRALDRAKPNCLDGVIHTCWSSPPGDGLSQEEREFAEDMDLGKYHFKNKNYRGAMFRYQHALELKPGEPEATFRLAEALNKLGKRDEAKENYQVYLDNQPRGEFADKARAALDQLKSSKPR